VTENKKMPEVWKRLGPDEFCLDRTFNDRKDAQKYVKDLNVWNLRQTYGDQDDIFVDSLCFSETTSLIHERMYFLGKPPANAYSNKSSS
jgi:hypothetical protein